MEEVQEEQNTEIQISKEYNTVKDILQVIIENSQ